MVLFLVSVGFAVVLVIIVPIRIRFPAGLVIALILAVVFVVTGFYIALSGKESYRSAHFTAPNDLVPRIELTVMGAWTCEALKGKIKLPISALKVL